LTEPGVNKNHLSADTISMTTSSGGESFMEMDTLESGTGDDSLFHIKNLKKYWDEIGWSFTQLDTNGLQAGGSPNQIVIETKDPKSGRWSIVGLISITYPTADSIKQTVTLLSDGTTMEFGQFKTGDDDLRARIVNTGYNNTRRILVTCKGLKR